MSCPTACVIKTKPSYTIKKKVSRRGAGLFTGEECEIILLPQEKGSGVFFQRIDLPGQPKFPLSLSLVQGTPRCTIIGNSSFSVQTVEHLMAVLNAFDIDNLLICLSGPEIPIFDGSSLVFLEMIEEAGLVPLGEKDVYNLKKPIYVSKGDACLVALPSEEFKISYTLHYPSSSCIGTQFYSLVLDKEVFSREIAPCRTFSVYEEVAPLIEKGFLKGGSLDNAVVIKNNQVMNAGGLRLPGEMVRHKILDLIGDLYLMGVSFSAHILAIRSGHHVNNILANELLNHFKEGNA